MQVTNKRITDKPTRPRRAVASSETARAINRDILLHAIHLHQPVSRADLARLTGLQPSTVSVIIGQLIDEGWVLPGTLGRLPRGRRPTFVTLNDRHVTLAIDLRPGRANLAVVDINGKLLGRDTVPYEIKAGSMADEARTAIAHIAQAAHALKAAFKDRAFQGLGVSVSGRVDQKTHRLLFSPNVPWGQIDLHEELQRVLETPIEMENAANACLISERWFGNFYDASNMLVVSVSEGIGTGMLVDGSVVRGRNDMAGEFGHMTINPDGELCRCGNRGCLELSGSFMKALELASRLHRRPIDIGQLVALAKSGDVGAARLIADTATQAGRGLAMIGAALNPPLFVIAGRGALAGDLIMAPLIAAYERHTLIRRDDVPDAMRPNFVVGRFTENDSLMGAVGLVLRHHGRLR